MASKEFIVLDVRKHMRQVVLNGRTWIHGGIFGGLLAVVGLFNFEHSTVMRVNFNVGTENDGFEYLARVFRDEVLNQFSDHANIINFLDSRVDVKRSIIFSISVAPRESMPGSYLLRTKTPFFFDQNIAKVLLTDYWEQVLERAKRRFAERSLIETTIRKKELELDLIDATARVQRRLDQEIWNLSDLPKNDEKMGLIAGRLVELTERLENIDQEPEILTIRNSIQKVLLEEVAIQTIHRIIDKSHEPYEEKFFQHPASQLLKLAAYFWAGVVMWMGLAFLFGAAKCELGSKC